MKRRKETCVTAGVKNQVAPVDLLWTGGWDSTYRLLDLVLTRRCAVQPWYLMDEERASTPLEQDAMRRILQAIEARDPDAVALVEDIQMVAVDDVASDEGVSAMCGRLRLGSQYDWLARFAAQQGLDRLELSVEKRDSRVCGLLRGNMEAVESRGGTTFRLAADPDNPDLELFRSFEFPILHLTKADLSAQAETKGWTELMELTWFCHDPRDGKPCGMCTPCLVALEEGLGERIPRLRRLWPRLRLLKRSLQR
jgi:hypothetical protein